MSRIRNEDVETEVEVEETKGKKSPAQVAFIKIIEAYKKSNPAKYELKKDELASKLAEIS